MKISDDPTRLPLAERFLVSQMLARELDEHLRQTFLPRLSALRHASKELNVEVVTDQAMLDHMTTAIQSDEYSDQLFTPLLRYLESIETETRGMLGVAEW